MRTEKIIINDKIYAIKIHIENRNNSRVSIGKTGINIRISRILNREEQFKEILKFKRWAIDRIKKNPIQEIKSKEYNDGDILRLINEDYRLSLILRNKKRSYGKIKGNNIVLNLSKKEDIPKMIRRVIIKNKLPYIKEKIERFNKNYFNHDIKDVFLKNTKSNWGSCSSKGNINISTRLFFAPEDVLDYICIHELAHLKEMNHSKKFWSIVEKIMPDYKEKEKWLKENKDNCDF